MKAALSPDETCIGRAARPPPQVACFWARQAAKLAGGFPGAAAAQWAAFADAAAALLQGGRHPHGPHPQVRPAGTSRLDCEERPHSVLWAAWDDVTRFTSAAVRIGPVLIFCRQRK